MGEGVTKSHVNCGLLNTHKIRYKKGIRGRRFLHAMLHKRPRAHALLASPFLTLVKFTSMAFLIKKEKREGRGIKRTKWRKYLWILFRKLMFPRPKECFF